MLSPAVKNKIKIGLWLLLAVLIIVLATVAALHKKNNLCKAVIIKVDTGLAQKFISNKQILSVVNLMGYATNFTVKKINIKRIEQNLAKNIWVKNVAVYFDAQDSLHIDIKQRMPIAKLFTLNGHKSYIDSSGVRMPAYTNTPSRLLVITGFPTAHNKLAAIDSSLLQTVTHIANYISNDSLLNAQIAQINITSEGGIELDAIVGKHTVVIGDDKHLDKKFERLKLFYQKVINKVGIEAYTSIDVRFKNQVVAVKRGFVAAAVIDTVQQQPVDSLNVQ